MSGKNEELIYIIETIINKGKARAQNLTMMPVYKLLYLAFLRLKEKNIDIHLPYSWYLHGAMVESSAFTRQTGLALGAYFHENNTADVVYSYSSTLTISENTQYEINQTIDTLLDIYIVKNRVNLTLLLKDVYATAPTEFQRIYKNKLLPCTSNKDTNRLIPILKELTANYPHEKYEDIFPRFLRFEELTNLALETKADEEDIKELAKIFWNYFAAVLRSRENENLTEEEIQQLKTFAEKKETEYDLLTFDYEEKYTLQLPPVDITDLSKEGQELLKDISTIAYNACTSER